MNVWSGGNSTLCFVFGSMLLRKRKEERCPHSFYICGARLVGYKYANVVSDDPKCTASGYATVLPNKRSVVYGMLLALTPEDEQKLDEKEDVEKGDYRKMECTVITDKGHSVSRVLIYVNKLTRQGPANPDYMENKVIPGAQSHGLPKGYVQELKNWVK